MLRLWKGHPYNGTPISMDGTFNSPAIFRFSADGGSEETPLWLRHDDLSLAGQSSYGVSVSAKDFSEPFDEDWVTFALDNDGEPGDYEQILDVGDILVGDMVAIWMRVDLPNAEDIGVHEDIFINVDIDSDSSVKNLDLRFGQFINCEYDPIDDCVKFDGGEFSHGSWQSPWLDEANYYGWSSAVAKVSSSGIKVAYRTSPDGTEENASTWMGTFPAIEVGHYLQVSVDFYVENWLGGEGKLLARAYSNSDFSVYLFSREVDTEPVEDVYSLSRESLEALVYPPPFSLRWFGQIYVDKSRRYICDIGQQFKKNRPTVPDFSKVIDGQSSRLFINDQLVIDCNDGIQGVEGSAVSFGEIFLRAGWHDIRIESNLLPSAFEEAIEHGQPTPLGWTKALGDMAFEMRIARAMPTDPQEDHEAIFSSFPRGLRLDSLGIECLTQASLRFDVQIYDGPDVPILIDPPIAYETKFFSPELTVWQSNCDQVEFQMDADSLFGTDLLSQWTTPCEPITYVTSASPESDRPPGIYYWRARGIKMGKYSHWSDWSILEILPLVTNDEFLYINVSYGIAPHDSSEDDRHIYLDANVGHEPDDAIDDSKIIYGNVNVASVLGKIIYPFQDRTEVRKEDFEGDEEFVTPVDFEP